MSSIWPAELWETSQTDAVRTSRALIISNTFGEQGPRNELLHVADPGTGPRGPGNVLEEALAEFGEVLGHTELHRSASGIPLIRGIVGRRPSPERACGSGPRRRSFTPNP